MRGRIWICLLLAGIAAASPAAATAETLVIPGTGACESILKGLAAAYEAGHPLHRIVVPPSVHSEGGIRAVIDRQAALARVSRALLPEEAGHGLKHLVFSKDVVVFAVGFGVTARNVSTRELTDIFSGKIDRWEQLKAGKGPIRVLLREPGDSNLRVLQKSIKEFRDLKFTEQSKILYHDQEMVEMLQKYKNAIGWATLSSLNAASNAVSPLGIDGVLPTPENILSGKYPFLIDFALVYREDSLPPVAKGFIDFIFSEEGRKILTAHGLVAARR